jgi:RNA polymerase sigma-70 factor (ECF subfamily)
MAESRQDRLTDWFRDWRVPLRRFLLRRRKDLAADADDIAQEVFLRLLRYDRSDLVEHPQAYLFKVALNVSAEWATRSSRRRQHSAAWIDKLVDPSTPDSELDRQLSDHAITAALAALPPRPREVLRLHFAEGLTYDGIATRLQVSRRIVKRDVITAYGMLRESLPVDALRVSVPAPDADETEELA